MFEMTLAKVAWHMVCVCIAIVLAFIVHSFISCGFIGMYINDDVLAEHYDVLGCNYNFLGWD